MLLFCEGVRHSIAHAFLPFADHGEDTAIGFQGSYDTHCIGPRFQTCALESSPYSDSPFLVCQNISLVETLRDLRVVNEDLLILNFDYSMVCQLFTKSARFCTLKGDGNKTSMRSQNPFIDDIQCNEDGFLSKNQIRLIRRMFLVRVTTAVVVCTFVYLLGDWSASRFVIQGGRTPVVYYGLILFTLLMFLFFCVGLWLLWGVIRVWHLVPKIPMRKTVGVPTKHPRGLPLFLPSIFGETKQRLHHGWVEVGDAPFGVLPSALYESIVSLEFGTFYYISLRTFGFMRYLIVNYKPQS